MSKFAGNNPTLKNALDLYKHGDAEQLHQVQQNIFKEKNFSPEGILEKFLGMK